MLTGSNFPLLLRTNDFRAKFWGCSGASSSSSTGTTHASGRASKILVHSSRVFVAIFDARIDLIASASPNWGRSSVEKNKRYYTGVMTLSIMGIFATLSILGLFAILSITVSSAVMLNVAMLSAGILASGRNNAGSSSILWTEKTCLKERKWFSREN